MTRQLLILLLTTLCYGCAATPKSLPAVGTPLGTVGIDWSMIQSGGALGGELMVYAGKNGGVIVTVGEGTSDAVSLYLSKPGIETFVKHLQKLEEWGEIARQEKLDRVKGVGSFSCQAEPSEGAAAIGTRFISSRNGTAWLGQARFCQLYDSKAVPEPAVGSNPCERDATFYLRPAETRALLEILQRVAPPAK